MITDGNQIKIYSQFPFVNFPPSIIKFHHIDKGNEFEDCEFLDVDENIWRPDFQNLLHQFLHVTHLQLMSQQKNKINKWNLKKKIKKLKKKIKKKIIFNTKFTANGKCWY